MSEFARMVNRSISDRIKSGFYDSEEELVEEYNSTVLSLLDYKEVAITNYRQTLVCDHLYGSPKFTIRRMLVGFNTVYEHTCNECGHSETATKSDQPLPDWTKDAKQRYYNNDI